MPSRSAVTISATANPSSIVAIHPTELVIARALRGDVTVALHVGNLVTGHAGPSAMLSPLDPLYPLSHRRAKSTILGIDNLAFVVYSQALGAAALNLVGVTVN
jgi:hypothetical protein